MPRYTQLANFHKDLAAGLITCEQMVHHYLSRIETTRSLNAYVEVYAEEALERARQLDQKYRENQRGIGKLFGMVVSIKDVICYKDHPVSAASKILEGYASPFSSTAVERLLAQDAILIGRTNCDQFAMGSDNANSIYGPVRNAADPDKVPGGSSGGSAVSVQADTCLVSLGSDTGGSVRQPAAFCGIVGLKPTYGRISRHGLIAYGSSFDQIGILSRSIEDAALVLEVIAGPDDYDSTASRKPVPPYTRELNFGRKANIAYFDTAVNHERMDPEIRKATLNYIHQLRADGHRVEAVPFNYLEYMIPAYYVLTTAEASSNLSRFDGIRYGYRGAGAHNLLETYRKTRTEGFSEEVRRRILLGAFVLSSGYYDAYYTKAQKVRRLIQQRTLDIFKNYDFILMPASPVLPWTIGAKSADPIEMYLADIYTVQANLAGIPGIAIPIGESKDKLPIGVQLMSAPFQEADLLAFSLDCMGRRNVVNG